MIRHNITLDLSQSLRNDVFEVDFDPVRASNVMEVVCTAYMAKHPTSIEPGATYCNSTFDSFSCWPTTKAGEVAKITCPDVSVADPTANATKECYENGTWAPAMYAACMLENDRGEHPFDHMVTLVTIAACFQSRHEQMKNVLGQLMFAATNLSSQLWIAGCCQYATKTISVRIIYDVGFSITTVVLIIALIIFLNFRSLRCLRNSIHCNLIVAFIFSNVTWLTVHNTLTQVLIKAPQWVCKFFVATTTYFHTAPFYWMFVEGLYLFTIVVWAFSAQKIRLWHYLIIGWATPFLVSVAWAVVKESLEDKTCWLHSGTPVDYIIHGPVLFLLASNVFFIVAIIWVLVTKMKASNTLETRQSRKAVKATVVLVPLLGLTYVLFLKPPFDDHILNSVFQHTNALLQSTQGLFVAIFYCFLNGEVKSLLRQRLNALQDSRTLSRYTKSSFFGSPRRSSCYVMAMTTCNGKAGNSKGSVNSKASRVGDADTEASALMLEKVGNSSDQPTVSNRPPLYANV